MLYDSFKSNEKINKILKSEQFKYSEKIMGMRIKLELDIFQIAKLLGVSPEFYLDIEYSSLDIPVEEYKTILGKLYDYEEYNQYFFKEIESIKKQIKGLSVRENKTIDSNKVYNSSFVLDKKEMVLVA